MFEDSAGLEPIEHWILGTFDVLHELKLQEQNGLAALLQFTSSQTNGLFLIRFFEAGEGTIPRRLREQFHYVYATEAPNYAIDMNVWYGSGDFDYAFNGECEETTNVFAQPKAA